MAGNVALDSPLYTPPWCCQTHGHSSPAPLSIQGSPVSSKHPLSLRPSIGHTRKSRFQGRRRSEGQREGLGRASAPCPIQQLSIQAWGHAAWEVVTSHPLPPRGNKLVAHCGSVPASPCVAGKLFPVLAPALHASPGFSWIRQFLTLTSLLSSDLSNSLHTSFNSLWSEGLEEPQKIPSARYPAYTHTCSPEQHESVNL